MSQVEIVRYSPGMADELTSMWHRSFTRALAPFRDPHSPDDRRRFLEETLSQRAEVLVAVSGRDILGFMAQRGPDIEALYLHVSHQGQGLGGRFITRAKRASPDYLHLYAFQRNLRARRFYRRHGFTEIAQGYINMEGLADVELEWWPRGASCRPLQGLSDREER